ncbi:MAG: DUF721 domain-containing protein [Methylobacteriaceae bacterium]|nr:DUF721 domain-containing protein [Methylobacteriaceae bacterium]
MDAKSLRDACAGRSDTRRRWAVPLADLVETCIAPSLAKQGFGAADILMHWPEIVGSRLASVCEPIRLQWPPRAHLRGPDDSSPSATLVVRVEGAFALDLQHLSAIVIERANAHLGWRCIDRIALRQGPLARRHGRRRPRADPDPKAVSRAAEVTAAIEPQGLRDALTRLGAHVFGGTRE